MQRSEIAPAGEERPSGESGFLDLALFDTGAGGDGVETGEEAIFCQQGIKIAFPDDPAIVHDQPSPSDNDTGRDSVTQTFGDKMQFHGFQSGVHPFGHGRPQLPREFFLNLILKGKGLNRLVPRILSMITLTICMPGTS
jgi:hypothetical protein